MGAHVTDDELLELVARLGGKAQAANFLGWHRSKLRRRYDKICSGPSEAPIEADEDITADLPDYESVKARIGSYNPDHIKGFYQEKIITKRLPHEPFIMGFIGDLHRDSPGHDVEWFERDMNALRAAQDEFPTLIVNMGDILDHWPTGGKLGKKHHDAHITRKEALALVRGFLQEEGLDFALHLLGNHDTWPGIDFATLMRQWTSARIVDWMAYIHVVTDKGFEWTTLAAHDFRGSSIHNPVHGLSRRAKEDGTADLYVAGHRHTGGQGKDQNGFRGQTYNFLRVRGYKRADEFGWVKGFPDDTEGATGIAVINPNARMQDGVCRTFYDLEEGLDWARLLRGRG